MCAKEVGGKLLFHLFTADGGQGTIDTVSGVVNNSVGGTYNLLRKYSENDIREAIDTVHTRDIVRFATACQNLKTLAL